MTPGHSTLKQKNSMAWWAVGLGLIAVVTGPLLGFGLLGVMLALATFASGAVAYGRGERSWLVWLGIGMAIAVMCYLPFMSSEYPYTTQ